MAALAIATALLEHLLSAPEQRQVLSLAAERLAGDNRSNRKEAQRMLAEMLKQY